MNEVTCVNIEVNSRGTNKAIKATILSDVRMKEVGFHKNYYEGTDYEQYSPYWWFTKPIKFPKSKRWRRAFIDFDVKIPKDGSDIEIVTLDMDFCQPYDYQEILNRDSKNECANIVKEQVEIWMKYLYDEGVLSGHVYGEYI